jgi:tetratricopeptide (TPR) repeat protein
VAPKAVEVDGTLGEAHAVLAYSMWRYEWDFAGAEKEFQRAEELADNSYVWGHAQFLSTIGKHEEAIRKFKQAQDLDPLTVLLKISAGKAYTDARQYDQAIKQFQGVLELDPKQSFAHRGLCEAYVLKRTYEEGIAECQKALDMSDSLSDQINLAWAYTMAGKRGEATRILNDWKNRMTQDYVPSLGIAALYIALGQKDNALSELEKADERRDDILLWLKVDPALDSLRSEPRFLMLLKKIGFPD